MVKVLSTFGLTGFFFPTGPPNQFSFILPVVLYIHKIGTRGIIGHDQQGFYVFAASGMTPVIFQGLM